MAELHHIATAQTVRLRPSHTVGRSPESHLALSDGWISGNHARLDWARGGWELRDLGSKNGTFVNGKRTRPGEPVRLSDNDLIAFGKLDDAWALRRCAEAGMGARRLSDGSFRWGAGNTLSLPDDENPTCTVFLDDDNHWVADHDGNQRPVENAELLVIDADTWELTLPLGYRDTIDITLPAATLADLHLRFRVSRNEEYVHLQAQHGDHVHDLGARSHHYVLLTLVRMRAAASARGRADPGWVYADELAHRLQIESSTLNVHVHRIRQCFGALPIEGGANIIERRAASRELRVAPVAFAIELG
jgi:hypothetical protein